MNNDQELLWLAFRYVSDELSAEEVEQFEERLAVDQAAREAVAEAVLMCEAVSAGAAIAPVGTVTPSIAVYRSWRQHAGWAAVGAAACLLLVLAIRSGNNEFEPPMTQ